MEIKKNKKEISNPSPLKTKFFLVQNRFSEISIKITRHAFHAHVHKTTQHGRPTTNCSKIKQ